MILHMKAISNTKKDVEFNEVYFQLIIIITIKTIRLGHPSLYWMQIFKSGLFIMIKG